MVCNNFNTTYAFYCSPILQKTAIILYLFVTSYEVNTFLFISFCSDSLFTAMSRMLYISWFVIVAWRNCVVLNKWFTGMLDRREDCKVHDSPTSILVICWAHNRQFLRNPLSRLLPLLLKCLDIFSFKTFTGLVCMNAILIHPAFHFTIRSNTQLYILD